jgi:hypothetical protein
MKSHPRANTENNTKTAQQHEHTEIGMNLERKNEEHCGSAHGRVQPAFGPISQQLAHV